MKEVLSNNIRAFVKITREIYLINNLKADILIEADILISERIILNFAI